MSDIKLKRGVADYVICGVAALFICGYLSVGFQPVGQDEPAPEPVAQEQQVDEPEPEQGSTSEEEPAPAEPELADMTVTFVDVGQGDCELVELPDGRVMLVDAGETPSAQTVLDALKETEVDDVDILVASHPHYDHIGGMEAVLSAYEVGEVWMPPNAPGDTDAYDAFLKAVEAEDCPVNEAVAGAEIVGEEAGYTVEVLAPAETEDSSDANRHSAIVRIDYGETSVLLTGDADSDQIVEANPGHVDVYKASHHGSGTGTNEAVMTETTPEFVVMSYAEGNDYGHPEQGALDAVTASGAKCYSTAANGDITFTLDGKDVTVQTEREGEIKAGMTAEEREAQEQAEAQAQAEAEAQAQAQQQQEQQSKTVVITPTGSRYHYPGCRTVRDSNVTEMTEDEAIAQGYTPCGICHP